MNKTLVAQLAFRYMRGKGSANAVPVLSRISMVAIAVSSCAMLILFSVFNGFEHLLGDLYKAFYPEIRITPASGKFFSPNPQRLQRVSQLKGVALITCVIEDNVLVNNDQEHIVATLKGIDKNYFRVNDVRTYISGADSVSGYPRPSAILGQHIASNLSLDIKNVFSSFTVYYPNTSVNNLSLAPTEAFQSQEFKADGIFRVQEEFDMKYILADISMVQQLMKEPGKISSVELKLEKNTSPESIQPELQRIMGKAFRVETRLEQNRSVYMVMRTEKWAGYAIFIFVLLIASFNMIGALSLLVLEKQQDIGILKTMGMTGKDIRWVILSEGVLWALAGGIAGIVGGLLLCWCQSYFQWVKIEGSFIIDAYPVQVQAGDVLVVLLTVAVVGLLAAIYPAQRAARRQITDIMSGK